LDIEDSLIEAHRDLPALMPYVHLPVQSGSDQILAAMNRKHTRAEYLAAIERLRDARPDLAFTSDFIVGFPGETEQDFRDTLALIEQVGYAGAYSFAYSSRPGTPAADMDDQVTDEVKSERLQRLQALITRQQRDYNARSVGRTVEVLIEKAGRLPGQLVGKTPYLQTVQVTAPSEMIGDVVPIAITDIGTNTLFGAIATPQHAALFAEAGA
jgi:tRNA-2-methylthio-N6-dimethylallyladenosine synthase